MNYKYHLKTLIALIFMLFCGANAFAQNIQVKGKVTDASTGETMPGVNILVKGTTNGTATNKKGQYSLTVVSNDTLIFSYIGYQHQIIPVQGRTTINVAMKSVSVKGQELVVIGYGEEKKSDKTGSITSVSSSDFNQGNISSPGQLLSGKVAGVTITPGGGAPGSGNTIRIRGGSSLSASNDPLYVVDGVPLQGGGISGMRNPLNAINPNDIKSMTVLKGASATAIYGSRASNGVIIITTKEGVKGQPLKVSYNGKFSVQTVAQTLNVLSANQFSNVVKSRYGSNVTSLLGNASTNWQNQIFNSAFNQEQNFSLSGAYKNLPYRASFDYTGDKGILKTSEMRRLTGSISLNPTFLNDNLKVNLNLRGVRVHNRFADWGAIGSAITFDPTQPVKVGKASAPYGGYFNWVDSHGNPITIAPGNPVAMLQQHYNASTVYRSIGNAKLNYTLPFFPDLNATLNVGYDYSKVGDGVNNIPDNAAFAYNGSKLTSGQRSNYHQLNKNQLLDFYLNYNKNISAISSKVKFTGGYSWEHHYSNGSTYTTNYDRADTLIVNQNTEYATEHYIISFFGRLNYSYKDKYLVTATLRDDGTSRFSPKNRWGLFPSVAVAWKLNKEGFLKNVDAISQLKLRLSYGETGEQRINQGDYPYLGKYTYSQPNADYQFGNQYIRTLRPEGYNPNLKWETTKTYDIGLDYGFLNNRISGSFDSYFKKTINLLNVIPVPAGTNFTNQILTNVGSLDVRGLEFNINAKPITTNNTYWTVNFNVSHEWNKITKLTNNNNPNYIGVLTGGISGGTGNTIQVNSVGYPRDAFFVYKQVYDKNGKPVQGVYVDRNGDGIINANDKYRYKSPTPSVTFGLSSKLQYENWDFSFTAKAELNNYVYDNVASNHDAYNGLFTSQGYLDNLLASAKSADFYSPQYYSDYYVQNASFIRLNNVSVGYTFKNIMNSKLKVRISGTVQNAFVITKYSGLNPEVYGGIDNNIYPIPRTFLLGLRLNY